MCKLVQTLLRSTRIERFGSPLNVRRSWGLAVSHPGGRSAGLR